MLASMNSPVKEELSRPSSKKKAGGTMMASKSRGCGKMQEGGPVTSMSMQTAKGSMMGYNCYDETKKRQSKGLIWYQNIRYNI
jgi:hypothetical protein